jgi:hypothetical protein
MAEMLFEGLILFFLLEKERKERGREGGWLGERGGFFSLYLSELNVH